MIQYTLQDIEKKIAAFSELMEIAVKNKNKSDYEKFDMIHKSFIKMKKEYFYK